MKRMETRLGSRKEDLSETSFFDGKIIKDCLPDSTIGQLLEYYDRAIRYNEHNLDVIENSVCTIFFHIVSTDDKLLQNLKQSFIYKNFLLEPVTLTIHMLKLGVFDVVVIFTAGNAGRLEELKKRSIFRNGKEREQEVAFENVNNLTLIQKFYYGQRKHLKCDVKSDVKF
ncbi:odorant receptor 13a-like [Vespula squamosa]|uniref:Odorant receptor 13a-like n=1 Tax=Vespula squamosa TaxID=30214 RepID=A0ABD2BHS9_VESSQ